MKSLLETTLNTRDLGRYRTKDGRDMKGGVLIRSDEPKHPSDRDIAYLLEQHITTVIDLRGKSDVRQAPSFFRGKMDFYYHNVPIEEGSHVPKSRQAVPDSYMKIAGSANISQVFRHIAHAPDGFFFTVRQEKTVQGWYRLFCFCWQKSANLILWQIIC